MKYCTDCKYFIRRNQWWPFDMCHHKGARDIIGHQMTAPMARNSLGPCGESAVLWEAVPPPPPKPVGFWARLFGRTPTVSEKP